MGKEIEIPILNDEHSVTVAWGSPRYLRSVAEHRDYGKMFKKKDFKNAEGMTYSRKRSEPLILLPNAPETPEEIATLAHEATHAVSATFKRIKEKKPGDEIFAHSVGAIVRGALNVRDLK